MKYLLILSLYIFSSITFAQENTFLVNSPTDKTYDKYTNFIFDNPGTDEAFIALIRIIEPDILSNNIEGAVDKLDLFKMDFPDKEKDIDKIIMLLQDTTETLEEINLGDGVNGPTKESSPIQTADNKTIYFTGRNRTGFDNETDDIFYATKENGVWTKAKKLDASFSDPKNNESPQGVTADGNTLVLFGNYEGTLGGGDLFFSERNEFGWSDLQHFPEPINTEYFDCDGKFTADNNFFIFTSDRPGAVGEFKKFGKYYNGSLYGNTDIYVCEKKPDGTWGDPINLGEVINTPMAERKPFLHPDGKTLYFASEGHPGLGRLDIFMSKRLSDSSWTEWSEPENLGKTINTPGNERAALLTTLGSLAFFAADNRDLNFGGSDIYSTLLPEGVRPEPVYILEGKVVDTEGFPLEADIVWEDLETGEKLGTVKSNPQDGSYYLTLPGGRLYGFFAEKEGFFPLSENIDLVDLNNSEAKEKDVELYRVSDMLGDDLEMAGSGDLLFDKFKFKRKRKIKMNNLFFDYNKSNLLRSSFPELDRIAYMLNNYEIHLVEVSGHTDSIGSVNYNKRLSQQRAKSVQKYLVQKGVAERKLVAKGYGPDEPIAPNDTEEGRAKNRRVELLILKSGRGVEQK